MRWEASSPSMQAKFRHEGFYPELLAALPESLAQELAQLRRFFSPYTKRVYMVGGSVRDLVRNAIGQAHAPIVDLDIEVYGIEPQTFDTLMQKLGAKGVGKSFFVYKYKQNIDISLPRIESKIGRGHRAFKVELAQDEKEASMRRDFRMNALMLDIFDGKLLDFWGGIEDIMKRRIAIIDSEKFKEDSLRVLRGMQFSARFGYRIEENSARIMRAIALDDLSHERIFWEFEKMFRASFLHYGLFYLFNLQIAHKLFGLHLSRSLYIRTAHEMQRALPHFEEHLRKFYFLYILAKNMHKSFTHFLDALHTPNGYYKAFRKQKSLPKRRSDRFLAALAMRFGLKEYLGNYKRDVKRRAKALGLWEEPFRPVAASQLLAEGLRGKALGEELRRRTLQIIRQRFAK